MVLKVKHRIIIGIGITFIGFGALIIVLFAIEPLWDANEMYHVPSCKYNLACETLPIFFAKKDEKGSVVSMIKGQITFQSDLAFVVNQRFNYTIDISTTEPNTKSIIFWLSVDKTEFEKIIEDTNKEIFNAKVDQRFINITKTDGKFHHQGNWINPFPRTVLMYGAFITHDNNLFLLGESPPLITLESQQVLRDVISNNETIFTNKILLGLTWMSIGLVFMLLGADFFVRVILHD